MKYLAMSKIPDVFEVTEGLTLYPYIPFVTQDEKLLTILRNLDVEITCIREPEAKNDSVAKLKTKRKRK